MNYIRQTSIPGRELYAFEAMNLCLLGRHDRANAEPPVPVHKNRPEVIVFTFLIKGCQNFRVGQQDYQLRGGDVFLVFPNEEWSTSGAPQEKSLFYWMHLRIPPKNQPLFGLIYEGDRDLTQALLRIRPRLFRGSSTLRKLLDEIREKCRQPRSPMITAWFPNQIIKLTYEILACAQQKRTTVVSPTIQRVIRYIQEHIDERLTVPRLAAHAGLPVSHFKIQFNAVTGIPPATYVLRAKVEEAKRRLLRGTTTITEIAFALGFSSSQYFATVFKRYTGQRPSALCKKPVFFVR